MSSASTTSVFTDSSSGTPTSTSAPAASTTSDNSGGFGNGGLGAASYYGAVAIVVVILIVVTLVSRVLYTRRMRRARAARMELQAIRDREERDGMARRGEEGGLPTYRESSHAALQARLSGNASGVTPPAPAHTTGNEDGTVAPPPYRPPPPKYEDSDLRDPESGGGSHELGRGGQARDASSVVEVPVLDSVEMTEMRSRRPSQDGDEDEATAYERRTRQGQHATIAEGGVAPRPAEADPLDGSSDRPYGSSAPSQPGDVVGAEERSWWSRLVRRDA